ncbi:VOC family protein [Candidatus Daviesbacteria bacterium]|nr:VOC family protein [Candidatus Daviesbacteria bacterium]
MDKVVHFEIPADDMARAKKFYEDIFGWKVNPWDKNYYLCTTVVTDEAMMPQEPGAINGGIQKRDEQVKAPILVIHVSNIDEYLEKVTAAGGTIIHPKVRIDDIIYYARITDSEGNILGLAQDVA